MSTKPDLKNFKHIAVIQTAFLGDVALSLYLVKKLKDEQPETKISFVTTPSASPLVMCLPEVDNVISYDKKGLQSGFRGIKFIAEELKERKVDCILSLHRSFRTAFLSYFTKPVYSVSFNKSALSVLYKYRIKYKPHLHEIQRDLSLLDSFDNINNHILQIPDLKIEIEDESKEFIENKLNEIGIKQGDDIIIIAPGSIWETKRWEENYFAELCLLFKDKGYKTVLIGSKVDKEICSRIAISSQSYNLAGEASIPQTLYLMKLSKLTVTNDSAPTHFAGLMNCPVVTVYGPTSPQFGFAPSGRNSRIVENESLKCKPCSIHGSHKCPIGTHECMKELKPEIVYMACMDVLRQS